MNGRLERLARAIGPTADGVDRAEVLRAVWRLAGGVTNEPPR